MVHVRLFSHLRLYISQKVKSDITTDKLWYDCYMSAFWSIQSINFVGKKNNCLQADDEAKSYCACMHGLSLNPNLHGAMHAVFEGHFVLPGKTILHLFPSPRLQIASIH